MSTTAETSVPAQARMPLALAASIQDDLLVVSNDLDRLQRLLDDVCTELSGHFFTALGEVQGLELPGERTQTLSQSLDGAVTALQFQDMASQLLVHTGSRLRATASLLAREAMPSEDEHEVALFDEPPLRPNPVTQDEIDAGSVELF